MPYDGHPFGNALEIIPCGLQPAAPFEPFAACRQGGFHEILAPEDALVSQGPVTRVAPGLNGFPPSQAADKPATGKLEPPAPPGLFPDEFPGTASHTITWTSREAWVMADLILPVARIGFRSVLLPFQLSLPRHLSR